VKFIVILEQNFLGEKVYLAPWRGDPGRTLVELNAKRFKTKAAAEIGLSKARDYRNFLSAEITEGPK
jgi:hypothetical protein